MEKALLEYLRTSREFERTYYVAKIYVRKYLNPYIDTLELSEDTKCNICFPLTEDNLFVLGLDEKKLTIWIFFDNNLADA